MRASREKEIIMEIEKNPEKELSPEDKLKQKVKNSPLRALQTLVQEKYGTSSPSTNFQPRTNPRPIY